MAQNDITPQLGVNLEGAEFNITAQLGAVMTAQIQGGTASISGVLPYVGTQAFSTLTGIPVYIGIAKTLLTTASAVSASGNNTIIAGIAGKRIKVYAYEIGPTGLAATAFGITCKLTDLVNDYSPVFDMSANNVTPIGPINPPGFLFGTLSGSGLTLNLNGNVSIGYAIHYFTDDAS